MGSCKGVNEMENEIKKISAVISALNNISVCGKANLANLSGSIAVLEDVLTSMQNRSADTRE